MTTSLRGQARATGQCSIRSRNGIPILDETYEYWVISNNINDTHVDVYATTGLPTVGVTSSPSGTGICNSKSCSRDATNQFLWKVVCTFSTEVDERQSSYNPGTDPTAWVPVYETKFERLQESVNTDRNGVAIANSAGQMFPTGMTISRFIPLWTIFQFEASTVTDEQIIDRNETVNNGTFRGRAANTLLLTVDSSVIGYYYGARRRLTSYTIRYNRKNWKHKRLDVGEAYLQGGVLKPYTIDGRLVMGNLNGSGGKSADGVAAAIREFDQYPAISFSFLRT